jgi:hypothetical protein
VVGCFTFSVLAVFEGLAFFSLSQSVGGRDGDCLRAFCHCGGCSGGFLRVLVLVVVVRVCCIGGVFPEVALEWISAMKERRSGDCRSSIRRQFIAQEEQKSWLEMERCSEDFFFGIHQNLYLRFLSVLIAGCDKKAVYAGVLSELAM